MSHDTSSVRHHRLPAPRLVNKHDRDLRPSPAATAAERGAARPPRHMIAAALAAGRRRGAERSREPDSSAGCGAGARFVRCADAECGTQSPRVLRELRALRYLLSVALGRVGGSAPVQPPSSPLSSNLTVASSSANAAQPLWSRLCPPPGEERSRAPLLRRQSRVTRRTRAAAVPACCHVSPRTDPAPNFLLGFILPLTARDRGDVDTSPPPPAHAPRHGLHPRDKGHTLHY